MQKGNETRNPLLKIEFKKVLSCLNMSCIEYFFSIKKLNRYNISISFSSTTRYLQRKIIPLSDLQFMFQHFWDTLYYYIPYNIGNNFRDAKN